MSIKESEESKWVTFVELINNVLYKSSQLREARALQSADSSMSHRYHAITDRTQQLYRENKQPYTYISSPAPGVRRVEEALGGSNQLHQRIQCLAATEVSPLRRGAFGKGGREVISQATVVLRKRCGSS